MYGARMVDREAEQSRDVKTAILEAAETVFAVYGFHGATTRAIAEEADVNLAMIHYHFGSKEQLHEKILTTRAGQLVARRLELLDAALANPKTLTSDGVLDALMRPLYEFAQADPVGARHYALLANQLVSGADERSRRMAADLFDELGRRFSLAFEKSLPALGRINAVWAYQYAIALGTQMLVRTERANRLAGNSHAAGLDQSYRITFQLLSSGIRALTELPRKTRRKTPARPAAGAKKAKAKATANR